MKSRIVVRLNSFLCAIISLFVGIAAHAEDFTHKRFLAVALDEYSFRLLADLDEVGYEYSIRSKEDVSIIVIHLGENDDLELLKDPNLNILHGTICSC